MILVCLKWVALRPVVDPLTGETITDARWSGVSGADQAALELALRIGALRNITVQALTVGETEYRVLLASVTYFKAKPGDQVSINVPEDGPAEWAALEPS